MRITFYGTRGSIPVSSKSQVKYGGNTTCLRIDSECLPENHWLVVDAGSGFVPLGRDALASEIGALTLLFSHYHHDHTQGFPLCPLTFMPEVQISCYGPLENGIGPLQVLRQVMQPPLFPVDFRQVAAHINTKAIEIPASYVLLFHPQGGRRLLEIDKFQKAEQQGIQVGFSLGRFHIRECLVVKMYYSHHPERTISYRFEERPTDRVFVFLTDHENLDALPQALRRHLNQAGLLVMDAQYSREKYERQTAGYGHGTPDYCVRVAHQVSAKKLGLTHHDPWADDPQVDAIRDEAEAMAEVLGYSGEIFSCRDYQRIEV